MRVFQKDLSEAAELLRNGGLIAVPTETVYGLDANGLDPLAVEKIYEVKGRPAIKPLSLMVHDSTAFSRYCHSVPPQARVLADRFWPGPLTIILPSREIVPEIVRAGGSTVGLRCPDHPMTLELLRLVDLPLAGPSANPSGQPSPKDADTVISYFDGQIDGVVDGGPCGIGRESTIIDMSSRPYRILRQGALPEKEITAALRDSMQVVGVTGPSGAGKGAVSAALQEQGALVIDCDRVYHRLLDTDEELNRQLCRAFPAAVEKGRINRKLLAKQVFSNPRDLLALNDISHRAVARQVDALIRQAAWDGVGMVCVDASELIGSPVEPLCTCTIGVTCDREIRRSRIMQRDGLTEQQAMQRILAQNAAEQNAPTCDYVVSNNGELSRLKTSIRIILEEISHERHER